MSLATSNRIVRSRRIRQRLLLSAAALATSAALAPAQTTNYFSYTGGSLAGSTWSTNPAGPFTNTFDATGGGYAVFQNETNFTGGNLVIAGMTVAANITLTATGGTISTFNDGVADLNIAPGVLADFGTQTWSSVATAGFSKSGTGTIALAGGNFGGGFTLNAGTVVARGDNAFGAGASNFLVINGGTIAASATRNFTGKFTNGITVAGNFQLGSSVGPSLVDANLTFSNNVNLGGAARTFTLGGTGTYTFSGAITNGGLILQSSGDGTAGVLALTNTAGTSNYAGTTLVRSGILRLDTTATGATAAGTGAIYVGDSSVTLSGSQAKVTYNNGATKTISNAFVVSGATTNVIGSAHTTNNLTYTGGITMNAPVTLLNENNGGLFFGTNGITVNNHQLTLQAMGNGSLTVNSTLTGTGPITASAAGTGIVFLGALNTGYSGNILVQQGTLQGNTDSAFGTGQITLANGARLTLGNASGSGRDYTMSKILVPTGTGTLNFASTTGRLNRISAIDLGTAGTGVTLQVTSTGNAGQSLVSGLVRLFGDSTFYVGQAPNGTLQNYNIQLGLQDVGGAYGITKTGPGTLMIGYTTTAASPIPAITGIAATYGGGTNVAEGTMRLGLDNALPSLTTLAVASGAQLDLSGSGGFPNVTVLVNQSVSGINDYSGTGGFVYGNTTNTTGAPVRTLTLAGTGTYGFSGVIADRPTTVRASNNLLAVNKTGSGTQTLSGANSYTGGTTLGGGTLKMGDNLALGANLRAIGTSTGNTANPATSGTTTVLAGATLDLNGRSLPSENLVLNGSGVGGNGALVNNGAVPVTISGGIGGLAITNVGSGFTSTPTVSITGADGTGATAAASLGLGTVSLDTTGVYNAIPTVSVSGGGGAGALILARVSLLAVNVSNQGNGYTSPPTVTVGGANGTGATATATVSGGKVTGVTVTNPGSGYTTLTFTFSGGGGTGAAAGASTVETSGLLISDAGSGYASLPTLAINGTGAGGATASVTTGVVNTIDLTSFGSGYTGALTASITGGGGTGATATVQPATTVNLASDSAVGGSSDIDVKAVITGGGMLTKVGAGTLTLSASNTYTGTTRLAGGTLRLGASERIVDTNVVDFAGGTLHTGGNEETLGEFNLTASSALDMGTGESVIAFNTIGAFDTSKSLQILNWDGSLVGDGTDQVYLTDGLTLTELQLASIQFVDPGELTGTFAATQLASGEVVAVVPEPGTLGLLAIGGLALLRRRRRNR